MSKEATARSAMKLALEALKQIDEAMPFPVAKLAQAALREALAEQPAQQEPVAWMTKDGEIYKHECWPEYEARPLVFGDTSPPTLSLAQRKPLTDMQVDGEWILVRDLDTNDVEKSRLFARAIEAAHGIYAPAELKENT